MTNRDLMEKRLAFIERCLSELRSLVDPARIQSDIAQQRLAERELQLAIQAALDAASHIVSEERLAEPTSNAELFEALTKRGIIPASLGALLVQAAKFRNVLVHAYVDVDPAIVRDIVENHLDELDQFVSVVRSYAKLR